MTDPTFLPAWRLAELIRGGAFSCLELLDHCIARVERLDGRTNAVVVRDFDRARERARALDRQRKDGRTTRLFGVPMTVKESPAAKAKTTKAPSSARVRKLGMVKLAMSQPAATANRSGKAIRTRNSASILKAP